MCCMHTALVTLLCTWEFRQPAHQNLAWPVALSAGPLLPSHCGAALFQQPRVRAVFRRELELYENAELEGILPAVAMISTNDDGKAHTSPGYVFPPFIIVANAARA